MSAKSSDQAGDRLIRVGVVVFALGALAILADVVPFFLGHADQPLALNFGTYLAPVGLGLALGGLLRSARAEHRRARAEVRGHDGRREP